MRIPTPQELGFPAKFDSWRDPQIHLLTQLLNSKRRVKVISAPTGSGKSAVYVAYAIITKRPTAFVTESRGLQDQLFHDFHSVGMVLLKGRRNYVCDLKDDYTCEDGREARCPHHGSVMCPSSKAEFKAATSRLVCLNYDKWTAARKYGTGLDHFTQVIFDEGHSAPSAVDRAIQFVLHRREVEETLRVNFPERTDTEEMANWKDWALEIKPIVDAMRDKAREKVASSPDPKPTWVRHYLHMKLLAKRIGVLALCNVKTWVCDTNYNAKGEEDGYKFDPIQTGRYAETALLLHIPSVVFVSATIRPKTMFHLHIPQAHFDFFDVPSEFDKDRCPIYHIPTMRVDAKARDLSPLWIKTDQIIGRRRDRKGIVQPISFARGSAAVSWSQYSNRMLVNPRGEAPTETVERFKLSGPGSILVSPSVTTGFDFPYSECEYQVVCKIPFPDGRSKIMKARQAADKEYGAYLAMNKLVQICGRGMRAKDDRCEVFILDDHMDWFLPRYAHLAPSWFRGFYRRVQTLPAPPPKLTGS